MAGHEGNVQGSKAQATQPPGAKKYGWSKQEGLEWVVLYPGCTLE